MKKRALAAVLALLAPAAAFAGAVEGNVPANRTTRVHAFTVADPSTCATPGKPKMSVKTEPQHGKVSFQWGFLPAGKAFKNCAGGRMRVMIVTYTPASGFRGTDSFAVGYSFENMAGYRHVGYRGQKFKLHVK